MNYSSSQTDVLLSFPAIRLGFPSASGLSSLTVFNVGLYFPLLTSCSLTSTICGAGWSTLIRLKFFQLHLPTFLLLFFLHPPGVNHNTDLSCLRYQAEP